MIEFAITLIMILLFVSIMSIGLLMNKPLKGSCGGINCECKNECE
tara:strand:+ start:479 stop:613 length:135 start_codon:yes stop_codon:yes gene_type:complete